MERGLVHRAMSTPVGELGLVASEEGLMRIAFVGDGIPETGVGDDIPETGVGTEAAEQHVHRAIEHLEEYFAGERREFEVDLDHGASGFRAETQLALAGVGYGETVTYTELAAMVGRPRAVRAVASACATNPLPIVLPCHRILRADGGLGGYRGGLDAKRWLLRMEGSLRD